MRILVWVSIEASGVCDKCLWYVIELSTQSTLRTSIPHRHLICEAFDTMPKISQSALLACSYCVLHCTSSFSYDEAYQPRGWNLIALPRAGVSCKDPLPPLVFLASPFHARRPSGLNTQCYSQVESSNGIKKVEHAGAVKAAEQG
jgi:hypothetical protein